MTVGLWILMLRQISWNKGRKKKKLPQKTEYEAEIVTFIISINNLRCRIPRKHQHDVLGWTVVSQGNVSNGAMWFKIIALTNSCSQMLIRVPFFFKHPPSS